MDNIENADPEVFQAMKNELDRQNNKINLIASENYASRAVLEAQGSIMTNKYAEGYPGKRYYGGCENVDAVETLAIERAKKLFKADHANVQPHSGSQANMAVYFAMLKPGDTIMGMDLSHGGHLTHGSPVSFSGKFFNVSHYGVSRENEIIDYDEVLKIAKESKPNMIICGASAYPRTIDFKAFKEVADEVGALLMADIAHIAGLIVADLHPNPFPYADIVTTTTHKTLRGSRGGMILCKEEYALPINKSIFPGIQGGPAMHSIAGKAVALKEAESQEFKNYQQKVVNNAQRLSTRLQEDGFDVVSGGTDNHLMLLNLTKNNITGKDAEALLGDVNIIVNKNTIPFETRSPFVTSGIRLGTPAITTRGLGEDHMDQLGGMIGKLINNHEDSSLKNEIKSWVSQVCNAHPVY